MGWDGTGGHWEVGSVGWETEWEVWEGDTVTRGVSSITLNSAPDILTLIVGQ